MKNILMLCVFLLMGTSAMSRDTTESQAPSAEEDIRRLEREWLDAGLNRDAAAMERIVARDFTITFGDGTIRDKAEIMRRLRLGTKNPDEYEWTEDSQVRIYGDAAVITGRFLYRSKDTVGESRYTDTYIKRARRWQVVASHLSSGVQQEAKSGAKKDQVSDQKAIESAISEFVNAYNAGDIARVLAYYGDDLVKIRHGSPA